jgi:hypothetical protein
MHPPDTVDLGDPLQVGEGVRWAQGVGGEVALARAASSATCAFMHEVAATFEARIDLGVKAKAEVERQLAEVLRQREEEGPLVEALGGEKAKREEADKKVGGGVELTRFMLIMLFQISNFISNFELRSFLSEFGSIWFQIMYLIWCKIYSIRFGIYLIRFRFFFSNRFRI